MALNTTVQTKEFILERLNKIAVSTKDLISTLEEAKKYYQESATNEPTFERVDATEVLLASALAIRDFLAEETTSGALGTVYPFEVRVEWLDPEIGATFDINSSTHDFRINNAEDVLDVFDQSTIDTVRVVGTETDNDKTEHTVIDYHDDTASHLAVGSTVTSTQSGLTIGGLRLVAVEV